MIYPVVADLAADGIADINARLTAMLAHALSRGRLLERPEGRILLPVP
jgi:hypothetical protein